MKKSVQTRTVHVRRETFFFFSDFSTHVLLSSYTYIYDKLITAEVELEESPPPEMTSDRHITAYRSYIMCV
jgi:hypothetical protein